MRLKATEIAVFILLFAILTVALYPLKAHSDEHVMVDCDNWSARVADNPEMNDSIRREINASSQFYNELCFKQAWSDLFAPAVNLFNRVISGIKGMF
jgi:hypothetical protein